jgi:hypothetical protein
MPIRQAEGAFSPEGRAPSVRAAHVHARWVPPADGQSESKISSGIDS